MSKRQSFLQDTAIVVSLINDPQIKQASFVGSIVDWVSSYIKAHIDPNNKVASVLSLLVPGILYAMGFRWISVLLSVAGVFGFNLESIFSSIVNTIQEPLHNGTLTPEHIDQASQSAIGNLGSAASFRDVDLFKLTVKHYQGKIVQAGMLPDFLKPLTGKILAKVIGWIFKAALASAGLMVLEDAGKKLLGEPSPLSSNPEQTEQSSFIPTSTSQTTFKINPDYEPEHFNVSSYWIETVAPDDIGTAIADWTHNIYPDTQDVPASQIQTLPDFQKVVSLIQAYNKSSAANYTFIPKQFHSRKQIVDSFMDQLAAQAPAHSSSVSTIPVANKKAL